MKKIICLLMILFCATNLLATTHGSKQATETIKIQLNEPLDSLYGIPRVPDSFHVITMADNGTNLAYSNRSTTYPFAVGVDTVKIYGDTIYYFEDQIQDIDGTAGNFLLSITCSFWYDDIPTYTFATVQVISDSLNELSREASLFDGALNLDNATGTLSDAQVDVVGVNLIQINGLANVADSLENMVDGGNDFILDVQQIRAINTAGSAFYGSSSSSNGHGFYLEATQSGQALHLANNGTGVALRIDAGGTGDNDAVYITGKNGGSGIHSVGGATGYDILADLQGSVSGSAGSVVAGVTISGTITTLDALNNYNPATDSVIVDVSSADAGLIPNFVDSTLDEVNTGAEHNVTNSLGRQIRELFSVGIVRNATAQAGSANTITLDVSASAVDGAYDPSIIYIYGGTGIGQTRLILEYNGTTKIAVVDRDWKVAPDATSEFYVMPDAGREHVNEGLAQGGSSTSITLNALASATDNVYNHQIVFIRSGTGQDQMRHVESYNGTTKVAVVDRAWSITPDVTSGYVMYPFVDFVNEIMDSLRGEPIPVIVMDTTVLGDTIMTKKDSLINQGSASSLTVEAIDLELTTNHGSGSWQSGSAGSGANIVTVFLIDSSGVADTISYVNCAIYSTAGSLLGSGQTGMLGSFNANLDDGDLQFVATYGASYYFPDTTITIVGSSGVDTVAILGYNNTGTAPASADQATVEGYEKNFNGSNLIGAVIECRRQLGTASASGSGFNISTLYGKDTTDASGYWSIPVYIASVYDQTPVRYTFIAKYKRQTVWKCDTLNVTVTGVINIADSIAVR